MHGLANMLRDGGWGAYLALAIGVIGTFVGVTALITLALSRRAAVWVGVAAMVFAMIAPSVGVLGMMSGRQRTEQALGGIELSSTRERIMKMGYLESQSAAKVGFGAAILPLVLGLGAALVGATGNRRIVAGAVALAAIVPTAGAFVASGSPLPAGKYDFDLEDDRKWDLVAARERVDITSALGCDDFDKALRDLRGDPTPIVPDWRDTATKCARSIFDDVRAGTSTTWTSKKLHDSPLLVDETLRKDLDQYMLSRGPTTESAPTVTGKLPPELVRRLVRARSSEMRACYEKGLAKNAALAGRVVTMFVIAADGSVSSVSDAGSDLPDPSVAECVRGAFKRLTFPAPEGGGTVSVVYPIVFTST